MNLRHLEIFYSVMVYGSLSEAAVILHISQPAASKLLKHAESRLGFALFERVKGKLQPTYEAQILFEQIKPIYEKINDINKLTYNLARNPQGRLSIGCLPSLGLSLIPKLTAIYLAKNPGVFITLGTDHTQVLEQKLLQREIDIAITFEPHSQHGIIAIPILQAPLVYIDSQLIMNKVVNIGAINEERWIQPDADSLLKIVKQHRTFDTNILNVQTYYMAAELVRQGIGCSITDIYTANYTLPKSMIYEIDPPLFITIYLLRSASATTTKAIQEFIDTVQKEINSITPKVN